MPARVAAAQPAAAGPSAARTRTVASTSSIGIKKKSATASSDSQASSSARASNHIKPSVPTERSTAAVRPSAPSRNGSQARTNGKTVVPPQPASSSDATRRRTTTAAASSSARTVTPKQPSQPPPDPLEPEEVIAALKEGKSVTPHTLTELLRHLNVTPEQLSLKPLLPLPTPTETPASSSRQPLHASRLCKLAFNAVMQSLAALITSGWRMLAAEADKNISPRPRNVLHLVDAFRIACRMVIADTTGEKDSKDGIRKFQMVLMTLKRIAALEINVALPTELRYLHEALMQRFPELRIESNMPASQSTDITPPSLLQLKCSDAAQKEESLLAFVLDFQAMVLSRLQVNGDILLSDLQELVAAVGAEEHGLLPWLRQTQTSNPIATHPTFLLLQRCCYQAERSLSLYVTKIDGKRPSEDSAKLEHQRLIFRARRAAVFCLLCSTFQGLPGQPGSALARRDALLQKAAKMLKSYWRECASADAATKTTVYNEAHATLLEFEAKLEQLDKDVPADDKWTALAAWTDVVNTWKWLAKHNGDFDTMDRLEGRNSSQEPGQTADSQPQVSASPEAWSVAHQRALSQCSSAIALFDVTRGDGVGMPESALRALAQTTDSLQSLQNLTGDEALRNDADASDLLKICERLLRRCRGEISAWQPASNESIHTADLASAVASMSIQDVRTDEKRETILRLMSQVAGAAMDALVTLTASSTSGIADTDSVSSSCSVLQSVRLLVVAQFDAVAHIKILEGSAQATLSRAMAFLQRYIVLSDTKGSCSDALPASEPSERQALVQEVRLLSSTASALGARQYKEAKYASAVSFMNPAANLLQYAAELGWTDEVGGTTLCSRWEHVSVCYRALSKHKETLAALHRYIAAVPLAQWQELERIAGLDTPVELFREDGSAVNAQTFKSSSFVRYDWPKFGRNLRTLAETSIIDLLAQQRGDSVHGVSAILKSSNVPDDARLMCLEHIITSDWLESRTPLDGVPDAADAILKVCCDLADLQVRPLRRARLLLRDLETRVLSGRRCNEAKSVLEEIQQLLDQHELASDEGLRSHIPVYRARLHLLSVLFIQRLDQPSRLAATSSQELTEAAKRATQCLRGLLATDKPLTPVKAASRAGSKVAAAPAKVVAGKTRQLTSTSDKPIKKREPLRKTTAPKQPSTPPTSSPVTPPRKMVDAGDNVTPLRRGSTTWSGSTRLLALAELICHQLIAYGHCLASLDLLKVLRRLAGDDVDLWTRTTIAVAKQYLVLGRAGKAMSFLSSASRYCAASQQISEVSQDTRFYYLLAQATTLAQSDSPSSRALAAYNEALELGRSIERAQGKQPRTSSLSRAFLKIDGHLRISSAADTYAVLMLASGDLRSAIEAATHATAYATRASSVVALLTKSRETDGVVEEDPFVSPSADPAQQAKEAQLQSLQAVPLQPASKKGRTIGSSSLPSLRVAAAHWKVNAALLSSYQKLARLNEIRGTAAQADMFATEAVHLADSLNLKLGLAQSLLLRAELRLQLGKKSDGEMDVARSLEVLSDVWLPEAAGLACIQGDQFAKDPETYAEAIKAYNTGQATLKALDKAVSEIEQVSPSSRATGGAKTLSPLVARKSSHGGQHRSPRSSLTTMTRSDVLLPELQARLLRRQAWLLQILGRGSESEEVMEQAQAVEALTGPSRTETHLLHGRIALQRALEQMQSDAIWGMIPEAAISVPMIAQQASSSGRQMTTSSAASAKVTMSLLTKASSAFSLALCATSQSSSASIPLRSALQGLSLATTLQATMSEAVGKSASLHKAMALSSASTITLRREFFDAIWSKLEPVGPLEDKDHWMAARTIDIRDKLTRETKASSRPSLLAAGPSKTEKVPARGRRAISEEPDESQDSNGHEADADGESTQDEESIMRTFWQGRRDQGLRESVFDEKPSKSSETLPTGWTVVSISLSKERNSIVLTRRSGCATLSDLVFSLPIDRQARREGEEEELTIEAALEEMNDIVTSSNDLTASAKNISDSAEMDARKMWWTGRRELDDRLRLLCESIELRWLGPFKSTFMDPLPVDRDSSAMTVLRSAFDRIVKRLCFPSGTLKKGSKVKLDEAILEVVAGLSSTNVADEELEDLLHFIADVHQFNGVPVAVDEADLDEITVDLRSALEDFRSTCTKVRRAQQEQEVDHHIFLILDKDTAPIPWESIPALRGRAVCRIPSMSFLQDRVEMARRLGASQDNDGAFHLPRECKTYYLLNPSGDLAKSQKRFEGYLRSIPNSRGLIGKAPGPNEYLDALGSHSLVLYFGHSGGEQYVKTTRLRALQRCAVTMLWGCSSAVLRDQGEYDRTGTPHNYMIAGAPAVVGQLFDATDKELDCLSESVLLHLGLKGEPSEDLKAAMKSSKARFEVSSSSLKRGDLAVAGKEIKKKKMSLARAVAESRDCCRLPYLTGSAPVVYGVPVYFDRD